MRLRCRLREIREARELTLRDVAEAAGTNRGTLSAIETGHRLPPDALVEPLEQAYGAPVHDWYPREVLLVIEYPERRVPGGTLLRRMEPA